jgi:hypothetical protein
MTKNTAVRLSKGDAISLVRARRHDRTRCTAAHIAIPAAATMGSMASPIYVVLRKV